METPPSEALNWKKGVEHKFNMSSLIKKNHNKQRPVVPTCTSGHSRKLL